jgi:hypothetical protein
MCCKELGEMQQVVEPSRLAKIYALSKKQQGRLFNEHMQLPEE